MMLLLIEKEDTEKEEDKHKEKDNCAESKAACHGRIVVYTQRS